MVSLAKGQKVSIDKNVNLCLIGLGWDPVTKNGVDLDLDSEVFLLGKNGKVVYESDFIFYGNLAHPSGSVKHLGDDTTGGNSETGDDEKIIVNLSKIPSYIERIAVTITIDGAEENGLNFGQVSNAYVRVVKIKSAKDEEGDEVVRFDLGEDFSDENSVIACEIIRSGSEWKFSAVGAGFTDGLLGLCERFGVEVE